MLWGVYDETVNEQMVLGGTQIKEAYHQQFGNENNVNPIKKTPLEVLNWNGSLRIVKMTTTVQQQAEAEPVPNIAMPGTSGENRRFQAVLTNMERSLLEKLELQQAQIAELRTRIEQQYEQLNGNIRRYGGTITSAFANQIRRQEEGGANQPQQQLRLNLLGAYGPPARDATLHPRPRDLMQLWQEWTEGIGDRKAAKDFTTAERNNKQGGIKQKFYRRLLIWKTQARLVDGGMNIVAANKKIHDITGATTISGVIERLIDFRKVFARNGGIHPQLRNG
jgi:hypothetical protein